MAQPSLFCKVVECRIRHEKQRVAEGLTAGLQSERCGREVIVGGRLAADQQRTVTGLPADYQTRLDDLRENQNSLGLAAKLPCFWLLGIEPVQRGDGIVAELACRGGECPADADQSDAGQCGASKEDRNVYSAS